MTSAGILYSFRRCPYAIRARLALAAAGLSVEVREVALKAKPPELLALSAKGTVPVLLQRNGEVLDESLAIWRWALGQIPGLKPAIEGQLAVGGAYDLIAECDGPFKEHLDGFRYGPADQGGTHWAAASAILKRWSASLEDQAGGDCSTAWLEPLGWALLPFVRQFRESDPNGFDQAQGMDWLKRWLEAFQAGRELAQVMEPPWAWRQAWRSPHWLYHLALESDWQQARREGAYSRSTREKSLEDVGFLHASWSHQVQSTWKRFFADCPELRLLVIDPGRLETAGIPLHLEPAPDTGELFPHIYGALPIEAVILAERFQPNPVRPQR